MESVIVEIPKSLLEIIKFDYNLQANVDYTVKDVVLKDDFFKDDEKHKALKKASIKAYKELKNYEFEKRNK